MGDNAAVGNHDALLKRRKAQRAQLKLKKAASAGNSPYNMGDSGNDLTSTSMIMVNDKVSSDSTVPKYYRVMKTEAESLPSIRPKSKTQIKQEEQIKKLKELADRPISRIRYDINYKLSDWDEEAEMKRTEEALRVKQEEEALRRQKEEERIKRETLMHQIALEEVKRKRVEEQKQKIEAEQRAIDLALAQQMEMAEQRAKEIREKQQRENQERLKRLEEREERRRKEREERKREELKKANLVEYEVDDSESYERHGTVKLEVKPPVPRPRTVTARSETERSKPEPRSEPARSKVETRIESKPEPKIMFEHSNMTDRERKRRALVQEETRKLSEKLMEEKKLLENKQKELDRLQKELLKKLDTSENEDEDVQLRREVQQELAPLKSVIKKLTRWGSDEEEEEETEFIVASTKPTTVNKSINRSLMKYRYSPITLERTTS